MKNPALESLNRIKLMMKYDSSKTLSENKTLIKENIFSSALVEVLGNLVTKKVLFLRAETEFPSIFKKGCYVYTDIVSNGNDYYFCIDSSTYDGGFRPRSSKTGQWTQANWSITADKIILKWGSNRNLEISENSKKELEKKQQTAKRDERLNNDQNKNLTSYPTCVQKLTGGKIVNSKGEGYTSDWWALKFGNIYYFPFLEGQDNGRALDGDAGQMFNYKCSEGGFPIKISGNAKTGGQTGGDTKTGGQTGGDTKTGGSKKQGTGYNWQPSPAITDVQSGKGTISKGMSGDSVTTIQNALINKGQKIKADGKFWKRTKNAVIAVQKELGLNQTGVVDKETYDKIVNAPKPNQESDFVKSADNSSGSSSSTELSAF
jgi:hypothetical protein